MFQLVPLLFTLLIIQDPKKPVEPPDEEVAPGLPDGEALPLPERVKWDLAKAVAMKTRSREQINLAGLWRFIPVLQREAPVVRREMGWFEMPGDWTSDGLRFFDARFRATEGIWRGKQLDAFPFAWAERDISVSNAETLKFLNRRVVLVLRGPWSQSEVYTSQRLKRLQLPGGDPEAQPEVSVHVEQVIGVDRSDARWFDLTEQLIYPGTTQISLRLKRDQSSNEKPGPAASQDAYVGLDLLPTGPRIEAIRLRRDTDGGEIEATVDLLCPKGFLNIPGEPIKTVPMLLKLRLVDTESGEAVRELEQPIGTMPEETRVVSVRMPWSAKQGAPPPERARLHVTLAQQKGGIYDDAYPLDFKPAELEMLP